MSNRSLLIFTATMAVLAVAASVWAHFALCFPGDLALSRDFQSLHSDVLLRAARVLSYAVADWRGILLVVLGSTIVWWRLGRVEALLAVAAGILSRLDTPLKLLVGRPRPSPDLVHVWVVEEGNGFPSGHALFVAAFFGFLAYLVFTRSRGRYRPVLGLSGFLLLILLVAASRVYLGVHWSSDVVGGYLFGAVLMGLLVLADRALSARARDS